MANHGIYKFHVKVAMGLYLYVHTTSRQGHIELPGILRHAKTYIKLKDNSGADKIIVKNQPYQLQNTSNFHNLVNESS